jgi:hypothetical protein
MKSEYSDLTQRYLVLIKIDAQNLFMRISERHEEYMEVFSLKRDRNIFKDVFSSRYQKTNLSDLAHLPIEVIELANTFYQEVDNLLWYLKQTQDMPNTIEDEIMRETAVIKRLFDNLKLYIDAELSGTKLETLSEVTENSDSVDSNDFFATEGEIQALEAEDDFLKSDTEFDFDQHNDS